jgi:hypothetical protein
LRPQAVASVFMYCSPRPWYSAGHHQPPDR